MWLLCSVGCHTNRTSASDKSQKKEKKSPVRLVSVLPTAAARNSFEEQACCNAHWLYFLLFLSTSYTSFTSFPFQMKWEAVQFGQVHLLSREDTRPWPDTTRATSTLQFLPLRGGTRPALTSGGAQSPPSVLLDSAQLHQDPDPVILRLFDLGYPVPEPGSFPVQTASIGEGARFPTRYPESNCLIYIIAGVVFSQK